MQRLKLFSFIMFAILVGLATGLFVKTGVKGLVVLAKNIPDTIANTVERKTHALREPSSHTPNVAMASTELGGGNDEPLIDKLLENFPGNDETLDESEVQGLSDPVIPDEGKGVVANLDLMKLYLYEDGEMVSEFDILSKGKQGSAWETPPGNFDVKFKTLNHFSSIGEVYMPNSMQFFGNYFIHGWPYYPDGTPVPEGYSGGCIRMDNEDMKEVYAFSDIGTTVTIIGGVKESQQRNFITEGEYKIFDDSVDFPNLTSGAYIVGDLDSGEIIAHKNADDVYAIASLSKLMTALVSLETVNQFQDTVISSRAVGTYGEQGNLKNGDTMEVGNLIYPLLLESSNDAAEVIAEHVGRNYFIANMNGKAKSIGLLNTSFDDPSGLSPKNVSTTEDLFKLTQYIYKYKSYIFYITRLPKYAIGEQTWYNNNAFKGEEYFLGGKNGYIEVAKKTLITTVELPLEEGGKRNIAIILLQGTDTNNDTKKVVAYLNKNVFYEAD